MYNLILDFRKINVGLEDERLMNGKKYYIYIYEVFGLFIKLGHFTLVLL